LLLLGNSPCKAQIQLQLKMISSGFQPHVLEARVGERVAIHISNHSGGSHNVIIPDFSIYTYNLKPGESVDVAFNPDKSGTFPFYSDYPGVIEANFQGKLIVK